MGKKGNKQQKKKQNNNKNKINLSERQSTKMVLSLRRDKKISEGEKKMRLYKINSRNH